MRYLLEVACESVEDARAAEAGGADRIELCTALELGGLTPSFGLFSEVMAAVRLPVCVMIRLQSSDYGYPDSEVHSMTRAVELFRQAEPAGFVFGALDRDGRADEATCRPLLEACEDTPAVFHRAFDRTPDAAEALETVIRLGFGRVLTSGGAETAVEGAERIAALRGRAAGRIEVLPCGKIRAANIEAVLRRTGCDQVHGAFNDRPGLRVSGEAVAAARAELDRLAGVLSSPS